MRNSITVALLLLATPALAQYEGRWAHSHERCAMEDDDGTIVVEQRGMKLWEEQCTFQRVARVGSTNSWHVQMTCQAEDAKPERLETVLSVGHGGRTMTTSTLGQLNSYVKCPAPVAFRHTSKSWERGEAYGKWSTAPGVCTTGGSDAHKLWSIASRVLDVGDTSCRVVEATDLPKGDKEGWYLSLECRRAGGPEITYTGTLSVRTRRWLVAHFYEYRGGTGAPDIDTRLYSCG